MNLRPSLHPSVLRTQVDYELLVSKSSLIARERSHGTRRPPPAAKLGPSISIPLTTVSMEGSFDAYVSISFPGAGGALSAPLLVDSGNNSLIFPEYAAIASLPGFAQNYQVLEYDIREPWGCPACKLRGPIKLPTADNGFLCIPDCIFYACTGPNEDGDRTNNFGTGCLVPRKLGTIDTQSPLAVCKDYPFAEFNYAPAVKIFQPGYGPLIVGNSFLTLYRDIPNGYQLFKIIEGQYWMSLRPKTLVVGNKRTNWPGDLATSSLALIDTGGGPVFLSDPENVIWARDWPPQAPLPRWVGGSYCCQATSANLVITLCDANKKEFSYTIDTKKLPPLVQGLTLVMCERCSYMGSLDDGKTPQNGMNIGGVSALFNYILIDYVSARVGLKAKPSELI